jgi:hypothetical protein
MKMFKKIVALWVSSAIVSRSQFESVYRKQTDSLGEFGLGEL